MGFKICAAITLLCSLDNRAGLKITYREKGHALIKQPRAWQRMLSGRRLDLLDPTPVDIEVEDIAHGLAFVARWNGQTVGNFAYSVAEHSLLVEQIFLRLYPKASPAHRLTDRKSVV